MNVTDMATEKLERGDVVFWDEQVGICAGIVQDFATQPSMVTVKRVNDTGGKVGEVVSKPPHVLRFHADKKQKVAT